MIIINIIYSMTFCWFITKYFKYKSSVENRKILTFLLMLILFASQILTMLYPPYDMFMVFMYAAITFVFSAVFLDGNIFEKLFITVLEHSLLSGISAILLLYSRAILKYDVKTMVDMSYWDFTKFSSSLIVIGIYYVMLRLILRIRENINIDESVIKSKQWILFTSIPLISTVLLITIVESTLTEKNNSIYSVYIIITITLSIFLNFIIYFIISNTQKNNEIIIEYALLKQSKLYEERNIKSIQKIYEETRTLKHDMKQYAECIIAEIDNIPDITQNQMNSINKIKYYLATVNTQMNSIQAIAFTGNRTVDNILNYKISMAKEHDIAVELNIMCKIAKISDMDISILMGNMLDNAIEANMRNKKSEKKIIISISRKKAYLSISIKNSIDYSILKSNPYFISTKSNSSHSIRGVGIKSIKSIAEKYNGMLNYYESENMITAEALLIVNVSSTNFNK